MKLIDADALKDTVKKQICGECLDKKCERNAYCSDEMMMMLIDAMPTVNIDWTKHETTTGGSKSVTVNPAYPLGGSGNYRCSNTADVDAVEVVRCKDCKFYSGCTDHQGICTNRYMDGFIVPDWYCADGERKDDVSD